MTAFVMQQAKSDKFPIASSSFPPVLLGKRSKTEDQSRQKAICKQKTSYQSGAFISLLVEISPGR